MFELVLDPNAGVLQTLVLGRLVANFWLDPAAYMLHGESGIINTP